MKILGAMQGLQQYEKTGTKRTQSEVRKGGEDGSTTSKGDSVRLSGEGMLFSRARRMAMDSPEVRVEKVRQLKALVESGEYRIDAHKTAAKLVEEDLELLY